MGLLETPQAPISDNPLFEEEVRIHAKLQEQRAALKRERAAFKSTQSYWRIKKVSKAEYPFERQIKKFMAICERFGFESLGQFLAIEMTYFAGGASVACLHKCYARWATELLGHNQIASKEAFGTRLGQKWQRVRTRNGRGWVMS